MQLSQTAIAVSRRMKDEVLVFCFLPMPFYINEEMYLEGITLSQEEFYERLQKDETISTSQPSPGKYAECGTTF